MKPSVIRPLVVAGACVLGACSGLKDVTAVGIVQPPAEANPPGAVARYAGGTKLFVGAALSAISNSAVFSDVWINSDFPGNGSSTYVDARRPGNVNFQTGGVFTT